MNNWGAAMLKALLLSSVLIAGTPAWASGAASTASSGAATSAQDQGPRSLTPEERAKALQELQDLQARMSRLETVLGVSGAAPTPVPPLERTPRGDHNLEVYGFVQLDAIQDFNRV